MTLTLKAIEGSTYIINAAFTDEDGSAAALKTGSTWSLTDTAGNIINSREDQTITAGSTDVDIVLTCADLLIGTNAEERIIYIDGTYDSTLGNDLCLKDEAHFFITDLVNVP